MLCVLDKTHCSHQNHEKRYMDMAVYRLIVFYK